MRKLQVACANVVNYYIIIGFLIGRIYGGNLQCITLDNAHGNCVAIKDCPELLGIFEKPIINPDEMELLAQCGAIGGEQKVCCAIIETTTKNIVNSEKFPGPNETLSHPSSSDNCGRTKESKLQSGKYAGLGEFPWMALIEYSKPTGHGFHCEGTLISNRHVLTAAHCVRGLPKGWKVISIRLGELNLLKDTDCDSNCADPPENIPVLDIIPHELYDGTNQHNIAILKLVRPVNFTDYILPICVPTTHDSTDTDLNLTIAGWGKTMNSSQSDLLMKMSVPVTPQNECISKYKKLKVELKKWQMCAGGVKEDSCIGGGPLMLFKQTVAGPIYYITGIFSFGPTECGAQDFPNVYTKVVEYFSWIKSTLKL